MRWAAVVALLLFAEPMLAGPLSERLPRTADSEAEEFGAGGLIRGRHADHVIAFTFDDGPSIEHTPAILDTLDRYHVPATFFVVGKRLAGDSARAKKRREIAADLLQRGHDLGNHTFAHANLRKIEPRAQRREIDVGERYVTRALGHRPYLFRAPYAGWTPAATHYLKRRGYTRVGWTFDVRDFWNRGQLGARVLDQIIKHRGGITVLHDTYASTAEELPKLLAALEARNCQRIRNGRPAIIPVSLHYFITDKSGARRLPPAHAVRREAAYRRRLSRVCAGIDKD